MTSRPRTEVGNVTLLLQSGRPRRSTVSEPLIGTSIPETGDQTFGQSPTSVGMYAR